MARILLSVAAVITLAACDGSEGGGGGAPTTPSTTLTTLSLAPATDLIRIKGSETFTANASFSDGTTRAVEATWGSDAAAVATVTAGRVAGVSSGQATIFADYQGQRATRLLRVVPDYHGRWSGALALTGCADEGDWKGACDEVDAGDLALLILSLTQTRDTLTGTADTDDFPITVQGSIRVPGHLVLQGSHIEPVEGIPIELSISNWETVTTDNDRMSGRVSFTFRTVALQGSVRLDSELRTVIKTSTTPLLPSAIRGDSALRQRLSRAVRAAKARKGS